MDLTRQVLYTTGSTRRVLHDGFYGPEGVARTFLREGVIITRDVIVCTHGVPT